MLPLLLLLAARVVDIRDVPALAFSRDAEMEQIVCRGVCPARVVCFNRGLDPDGYPTWRCVDADTERALVYTSLVCSHVDDTRIVEGACTITVPGATPPSVWPLVAGGSGVLLAVATAMLMVPRRRAVKYAGV